MKAQGGVPAYYETNQRKAQLLYDAIEGSNGFFASPVNPKDRQAGHLTPALLAWALPPAKPDGRRPKRSITAALHWCTGSAAEPGAVADSTSGRRSQMNVPFTIPASQELEKAFVAQATKEGMVQLKGHRWGPCCLCVQAAA